MIRRLSTIVLALLLFAGSAQAATFYAAQTAAGDGTGSSYANRMSVASHNAATFTAGDTIYLCDTITSQIIPPTDGSILSRITYRGDLADHAVIIDWAGNPQVKLDGIDGIIFQSVTSRNGVIGYASQGASDYIDFRNCTIHTMTTKGILFQRSATYYDGSDTIANNTYITIGGSSTTGNELYNIGNNTGGTDISFQYTDNWKISHNKLYATGTTYGVDGFACHNSSYGLIEHNVIYSHISSTGGEDGIDFKENSHDCVVRYNHIYGHTRQTGITVQMGSKNIDIYNNVIHGSGWAGILIKKGNYSTATNMLDINVFGNLIYGNASGVMVQNSGTAPVTITDVDIIGNTIADNGNVNEYQGAGITIDYVGAAGTHIIKNNIFYQNTCVSGGSDPYQQVKLGTGVTVTMAGNQYYYPGQSGADMFTLGTTDYSLTEWKAAGYDTDSVESDPYFTDASNDDFTLLGTSSENAADLSGGPGSVTIQGTAITPLYDDAMSPYSVFVAATLPSILTGDQDSYGAGWEYGAFYYIPVDQPDPEPDLACNSLSLSLSATDDEAAPVGQTDLYRDKGVIVTKSGGFPNGCSVWIKIKADQGDVSSKTLTVQEVTVDGSKNVTGVASTLGTIAGSSLTVASGWHLVSIEEAIAEGNGIRLTIGAYDAANFIRVFRSTTPSVYAGSEDDIEFAVWASDGSYTAGYDAYDLAIRIYESTSTCTETTAYTTENAHQDTHSNTLIRGVVAGRDFTNICSVKFKFTEAGDISGKTFRLATAPTSGNDFTKASQVDVAEFAGNGAWSETEYEIDTSAAPFDLPSGYALFIYSTAGADSTNYLRFRMTTTADVGSDFGPVRAWTYTTGVYNSQTNYDIYIKVKELVGDAVPAISITGISLLSDVSDAPTITDNPTATWTDTTTRYIFIETSRAIDTIGGTPLGASYIPLNIGLNALYYGYRSLGGRYGLVYSITPVIGSRSTDLSFTGVDNLVCGDGVSFTDSDANDLCSAKTLPRADIGGTGAITVAVPKNLSTGTAWTINVWGDDAPTTIVDGDRFIVY